MMEPKIMADHETDLVLNDVKGERIRQDRKFGPSHADRPFMEILVEEIGEVARAVLERKSKEDLYEELIQVAAVAVAWAEWIRDSAVNG